MRVKKLKPAPSFHCRDMQTAIDNICEYEFNTELARVSARIYFYRTRLNMKPNQVAAIFNKHPHDINEIAKRIGANKNRVIKTIEYNFMKQFEKYHTKRYRKHILKIANRI